MRSTTKLYFYHCRLLGGIVTALHLTLLQSKPLYFKLKALNSNLAGVYIIHFDHNLQHIIFFPDDR